MTLRIGVGRRWVLQFVIWSIVTTAAVTLGVAPDRAWAQPPATSGVAAATEPGYTLDNDPTKDGKPGWRSRPCLNQTVDDSVPAQAYGSTLIGLIKKVSARSAYRCIAGLYRATRSRIAARCLTADSLGDVYFYGECGASTGVEGIAQARAIAIMNGRFARTGPEVTPFIQWEVGVGAGRRADIVGDC